jgi:hypothetical protein
LPRAALKSRNSFVTIANLCQERVDLGEEWGFWGEITGNRVISKVGAGCFAVAGAHEASKGLCRVESEGLFEY